VIVFVQALGRGDERRFVAATDNSWNGSYWFIEWGNAFQSICTSNRSAEECDEWFLTVVGRMTETNNKYFQTWEMIGSPFVISVDSPHQVEKFQFIDFL